MRIRCNICGAAVSTEVLDGTIIRAWIECPECNQALELVTAPTMAGCLAAMEVKP